MSKPIQRPGLNELIVSLEEALLAFDRLRAESLIEEAAEHMEVMSLIDAVMVPAMERVGDRWEQGTAALAQVYMSGKICERIVDKLLPPHAPGRIKQPPMAIAVFEDKHMLGQRIVYSVMRSSGFELANYGACTSEALVDKVRQDGIRVLLLSTLMLSSALRIKPLVQTLREQQLGVRVVVGGAPFIFDNELWREIGADAMCTHASQAPATVRAIMEEVRS